MRRPAMEAIYSGAEKGETYGLNTVTGDTCKKCHNAESPTYDKSKPFNFKERSQQIVHPVPKS